MEAVPVLSIGEYRQLKDLQQKHDAVLFFYMDNISYLLPNAASNEQIQNLIHSLMPADFDDQQARKALLKLWLCTKHERMAEQDKVAMLEIYARKLSIYDMQHVRIVLEDMTNTCNWWPAWGDIADALNEFAGPRIVLIKQLQRHLAKRNQQ